MAPVTRTTEPELLSIAAAARRLGRSWEWTFAAAQSGDLPGVRIRGRWYVRNLSAFLDAAQTNQTSGRAARVAAERSQRRSHEEECRALGIEPLHEFS